MGNKDEGEGETVKGNMYEGGGREQVERDGKGRGRRGNRKAIGRTPVEMNR